MTPTEVKYKAKKHKSAAIEGFARFGLVAKGVVYCLIGILAAMAALNIGGETTGKKGVFKAILEQPFGQVALILVAIGLLGYVMWRMIEAIKDPDNKGTDFKGIITRLGYVWSGLVYLMLAAYAGYWALSGSSGGEGGSTKESMTAKILGLPAGPWIIGAIAVGLVVFGGVQIYRAISGKFKKKVAESEMDSKKQAFFMKAGRFGYISRGTVLGIIGYLLLLAALNHNADKAGGTEAAMDFLHSSPFGKWLMLAVAVGLIGYGVFMFVKARYHKMSAV